MTNRQTLDERAQGHGWRRDEFPLFSGNLMTTYSRGEDAVQAETNPFGGLAWLARCAGGWVIEAFDIHNDRGLLAKALEWLSAPTGEAA